MATAFISTSAELVLLNTTTRPGVVILPLTTTIPGRILTFKDTRGTFGTNPITFSTAAANQTLENNTNRLTYNDPFGSYSFIAGFDNKWYTIGGSRMFSATISSITTINLTSQRISTGNINVSTLQFRDTATTSTNTLFSLSTNVYYSSPVSFFVLGPTKAPKSLFTPIRRPFLPNQIAGLTVWLDSADTNTVVATGNTVTRWIDKSGRRNDAITVVGTINNNSFFQNSLPSLTFGAASQMNFANITFTSGTRSLFVVVNVGATPIGTIYVFLAGGTAFTSVLLYANGTSPATLEYNRSQTQLKVTQPPINFFNKTSIVSATNGSGILSVDGTQQTLSVNDATAFNTGSAQQFLGQNITASGGGPNTLPFNMCEFILYDSAITLPLQQQQIEGYLAWKWGLVGNLPSNHPYKNSPP